MAIIYSCDFCEKEFNLQIKLKKHIQADHASPKELDPSDFLDEDMEFTDDEKAEYYDDLKAKYDEVKNKVEFFKKHYSFINKDISLTKEMWKALLRFWPFANSDKEIFFLNYLNETIGFLSGE